MLNGLVITAVQLTPEQMAFARASFLGVSPAESEYCTPIGELQPGFWRATGTYTRKPPLEVVSRSYLTDCSCLQTSCRHLCAVGRTTTGRSICRARARRSQHTRNPPLLVISGSILTDGF